MFSWWKTLGKRKCKVEQEVDSSATKRKTKSEEKKKKKKKNSIKVHELQPEESDSNQIVNLESENKVRKREVVIVPIFNSIPCVNVEEYSPSDNNNKREQCSKTNINRKEEHSNDSNINAMEYCQEPIRSNNIANSNNLETTNSPSNNDTETTTSNTITNNIVHFWHDGKEKFAAESCSALLSRSYLSLGGVISHCNNSATDSKRRNEENTKNKLNKNSKNVSEEQMLEMNKKEFGVSCTTISSSYNSFSSSMVSLSSSSSSSSSSSLSECEESSKELNSSEKELQEEELEEEEKEEEELSSESEEQSSLYQLENEENECIKHSLDHPLRHKHEQELKHGKNFTFKAEKSSSNLEKPYSSLTSVKLARLHSEHHTIKQNKKKHSVRSLSSSLSSQQELCEEEDGCDERNPINCFSSSFTSHSNSHLLPLQGAFWTSGPLRNEASSFSEWEAEENKQYAQGQKLRMQCVSVPDQSIQPAEAISNNTDNNKISIGVKKHSYSSPLNTFDSFSYTSQTSASLSPLSSMCRHRYSDSTLTLGSRKAIKKQNFNSNNNINFCVDNTSMVQNVNNNNINVTEVNTKSSNVNNSSSSNSNAMNNEFVMSPLRTFHSKNFNALFDEKNNMQTEKENSDCISVNEEIREVDENKCDEKQEHTVKEQTKKKISTTTTISRNPIAHTEEFEAAPKNSYGLSNSNEENDVNMKKRREEEHEYNVIYSPWRHFYSQFNQIDVVCEERIVKDEKKAVDVQGNCVNSSNRIECNEHYTEEKPLVDVYNDSIRREWEELCLTSSDEKAEKLQKEKELKEKEIQNTVKDSVNETETKMSIKLQEHAERAAWRRQMKKMLDCNISQIFYYDDVDNGALKVIRHVLSKQFYLKEEDEVNSKTHGSSTSMKRHSSCSSKNADGNRRKRSSVSVSSNKRKKQREKMWRGSISTLRVINKKNEHLSKYYCNSHKQFLETLKARKVYNQLHYSTKSIECIVNRESNANTTTFTEGRNTEEENLQSVAAMPQQPEKEQLSNDMKIDFSIDALFTVLPVPLEKRVAGRVALEAYYACYQGKPIISNEESYCSSSNNKGNKKYSVISSKSNVSSRQKYSKSVSDNKKYGHRRSNYSVRSKSTNVLHSKVSDANQAVHPHTSTIAAANNNNNTYNSKSKSNVLSHSLEEGDVCDNKCQCISRLGRTIDTSFCSRMLKTKEKGQKLRDDWSRPSLHFSLASSLNFENIEDENEDKDKDDVKCANTIEDTQEVVKKKEESNKLTECENVKKTEEIDDSNSNKKSNQVTVNTDNHFLKHNDKLTPQNTSERIKIKNENMNKIKKCTRQFEHRQHIATIITEEDNLWEQQWKHETLGKKIYNTDIHCKEDNVADNAVHQTELPDIRPCIEEVNGCNNNNTMNVRMFSPPIDTVAPASILKKQSELPSFAKQSVKCHVDKNVMSRVRNTAQRNVANKTACEHYKRHKKHFTSELSNIEFTNSVNTLERRNSEYGEANYTSIDDEKDSERNVAKHEPRTFTENSLSDVEMFDRECESEPRSYQRVNKYYSSSNNNNNHENVLPRSCNHAIIISDNTETTINNNSSNGNGVGDDVRSSKSIATTMTTMTTNTITSSSVGAINSRESHTIGNENDDDDDDDDVDVEEDEEGEDGKVNIRYRLCELHTQASKSGISSTNTSHYITGESNSSRISPLRQEHEFEEEEELDGVEEFEELSVLSSQKQMTDRPFLFSYSQRSRERAPVYTSREPHTGLLESSKNSRMSSIHTVHLNHYNSNDENSMCSNNNIIIDNNNFIDENEDNTLITTHNMISKTDSLSFAHFTEDNFTKQVQASASTRWITPFNLIEKNNSIKTLEQSANDSVKEEISSLSKTEQSNNSLMKRNKQVKMCGQKFKVVNEDKNNKNKKSNNSNVKLEMDSDVNSRQLNLKTQTYHDDNNNNIYKYNEANYSNEQKCLHEQETHEVHSIAQKKKTTICTSNEKSITVDIERAKTIPEWREECISSESSVCAMLSCTLPKASKLSICHEHENILKSDYSCLGYEAQELHKEESKCKVNLLAETSQTSTTHPSSHMMLNVEQMKHDEEESPQQSQFDTTSPNARTANASITEMDKENGL